MRKGKSFLLNLLIIFLESEMDNRCFSDDTKEIPQIFPWKKGQDRVTSGIWIWSKPYMITGQDGKKVAVLLMDTQGAFDRNSKNKTETDIFTLSSLLSTVQIYNVKDNIDENVLRPLSDLCNYALEVFRLSQNEHLDQNAKVLQNLTFLIRDFQDDENYSFGTKGGKLYLDKQLSTSESDDPDVQVVRANISKTFNSLNCCLLPYPGVIIAGHKGIDRNVTFGDMDEDFRFQVLKFFLNLLNPENISPKTIGGVKITGDNFLNYLYMYCDLLQSNQFSEPTTTMKAQAKASAQSVTQTLIRTYCETMDASNQNYRSKSALNDQHEQEKEKALAEFCRLFTSPYRDLVSEYKDVLFREIEKEKKNQEQNRHVKELLERNRCNRVVDEGLQLYKDNRKHGKKTARQNALTMFDQQTSEDLDFKEVYKAELKKKIDAYDRFKDEEDRLKQEIGELSEVCHEALAIFEDDINKLKGKYVPHEQLAENHNQCRKKALKYFQQSANQKGYNQKNVAYSKNQLNNRLQSFYEHLLRENEKLLKKIKDRFEIHKEELKQQHLDYMNKLTEKIHVLPQTLRAIHEIFIKKVAEEHKKWEKTPLHKDQKENEIEALEESYTRLAEEMKRRKGKYRTASHWFVLIRAGWSSASITIAALAIGVAIVLLPIEIGAGVMASIAVGAITLFGFIK